MSASLADQLATTALSGANADFIEELYQRYLSDPKSIDSGWAQYFASLQAGAAPEKPRRSPPSESRRGRARPPRASAPSGPAASASTAGRLRPIRGAASAKQAAVSRLIQVYCNRGHLIAHLDPLDLSPRAKPYHSRPRVLRPDGGRYGDRVRHRQPHVGDPGRA